MPMIPAYCMAVMCLCLPGTPGAGASGLKLPPVDWTTAATTMSVQSRSSQGRALRGMLIGAGAGAAFGMWFGYNVAERGDRGKMMVNAGFLFGVVGAAIGYQVSK